MWTRSGNEKTKCESDTQEPGECVIDALFISATRMMARRQRCEKKWKLEHWEDETATIAESERKTSPQAGVS